MGLDIAVNDLELPSLQSLSDHLEIRSNNVKLKSLLSVKGYVDIAGDNADLSTLVSIGGELSVTGRNPNLGSLLGALKGIQIFSDHVQIPSLVDAGQSIRLSGTGTSLPSVRRIDGYEFVPDPDKQQERLRRLAETALSNGFSCMSDYEDSNWDNWLRRMPIEKWAIRLEGEAGRDLDNKIGSLNAIFALFGARGVEIASISHREKLLFALQSLLQQPLSELSI